MSIGAIIFCRLDSTRLPGKVLRRAQGRPLLDYLLARVRRIPEWNSIVVATSDRLVDDPLELFCHQHQVSIFRGDLEDVAGRALACARQFGMSHFCRINGDSPFVEPGLVSMGMRVAEEGSFDLVTNLCPRSFPYGVSVEILRTDAFERAYQQMSQPEHREHVTKYLYENLEQFRFLNIACPHGDLSARRMTIDTEEDFHRFEQVLSQLEQSWEEMSYREVLPILEALDQVQDGVRT